MKKYLLAIIIAFSAICAYSQAENPHLSFMGIPIDGSSTLFIEKLKKKNFTLLCNEDDVILFSGKFAGYTGCYIYVSTQIQKNLVSGVNVALPARNSWSALYDDYSRIKDLLTQKYGEPLSVVENFENETFDDIDKLIAVESGNCKYTTTFGTEKGMIVLRIAHISYDDNVTIGYYDKINFYR